MDKITDIQEGKIVKMGKDKVNKVISQRKYKISFLFGFLFIAISIFYSPYSKPSPPIDIFLDTIASYMTVLFAEILSLKTITL